MTRFWINGYEQPEGLIVLYRCLLIDGNEIVGIEVDDGEYRLKMKWWIGELFDIADVTITTGETND